MARATYVLRNGKLVDKRRAAPLRAVHVISDAMAPTVHMADGKTYTSKSQFRARTKAAGCIEVGNESLTVKTVEMSRAERVESIKQAFAMHEQGYRPPPTPQMNHKDWS